MSPTRTALIVMFFIFITIAGLYAYQIFSGAQPQGACGDNKCQQGENCLSCPQDCVCKAGAYCSEQGKCVKSVCGDGNCGPGENIANCCDDCGCSQEGMICNKETHTCEFPEAPISDERVEEVVRAYYTEQNKTITSMEITGSAMVAGELVKVVSITLEDEEYERLVSVTVNGEIAEELFRW